jgi:TraY domain
MAKGGRARGRPRLGDETAKRAAFNTRVRTALKQSLEAAAERNGRSLSEEIEFRLERSLDEERTLVSAFELGFGRTVAAITLAIGHVIREAVPPDWTSDPEAFREAVDGVKLLLAILDPGAKLEDLARLKGAFLVDSDDIGAERFASAVAAAIADAEQEQLIDFGPLIPVIRKWLGATLIGRMRERLGLPLPKSARSRRWVS